MRIRLKQFCDSAAPRTQPRCPDHEAGLTLIEMMIVLVIIAVVAGLITMNVIGRPDQARVTRAGVDLKTISSALLTYRLDNGDYPTTEQGLKALVQRPTSAPVPQAWGGSYLAGSSEEPKDPWGHPFVYTADPGGFTLKSLGRDGKPGGEGVDADIDSKQG